MPRSNSMGESLRSESGGGSSLSDCSPPASERRYSQTTTPTRPSQQVWSSLVPFAFHWKCFVSVLLNWCHICFKRAMVDVCYFLYMLFCDMWWVERCQLLVETMLELFVFIWYTGKIFTFKMYSCVKSEMSKPHPIIFSVHRCMNCGSFVLSYIDIFVVRIVICMITVQTSNISCVCACQKFMGWNSGVFIIYLFMFFFFISFFYYHYFLNFLHVSGLCVSFYNINSIKELGKPSVLQWTIWWRWWQKLSPVIWYPQLLWNENHKKLQQFVMTGPTSYYYITVHTPSHCNTFHF